MRIFGLDLGKREDFSTFYKQRKDCFGKELPAWFIDNNVENLMDKDSASLAHQEANKCLDEKVKNGMYIKERGYKLLPVLSTIAIALLGLAGFIAHQDNSSIVRLLSMCSFLFCIVWLFCITYYLIEHLLCASDYWSQGENIDYFINKDLLEWCDSEKKDKTLYLILYELNKIQDKIYFNESENSRRLHVINMVFCPLAYFIVFFIFLLCLYLGFAF